MTKKRASRDGFAADGRVKAPGLVGIRGFEHRGVPRDHAHADPRPERVVHGVAQHGGAEQKARREGEVSRHAARAQRAPRRRAESRRAEGRDDQPRLAEDHREERAVRQDAALREQREQTLVHVEREIEERREERGVRGARRRRRRARARSRVRAPRRRRRGRRAPNAAAARAERASRHGRRERVSLAIGRRGRAFREEPRVVRRFRAAVRAAAAAAARARRRPLLERDRESRPDVQASPARCVGAARRTRRRRSPRARSRLRAAELDPRAWPSIERDAATRGGGGARASGARAARVAPPSLPPILSAARFAADERPRDARARARCHERVSAPAAHS